MTPLHKNDLSLLVERGYCYNQTNIHTRTHTIVCNSHTRPSKLYLLIKDDVERESVAEGLQINVEFPGVDRLKAPQ